MSSSSRSHTETPETRKRSPLWKPNMPRWKYVHFLEDDRERLLTDLQRKDAEIERLERTEADLRRWLDAVGVTKETPVSSPSRSHTDTQERLLRAIDAADKASTSMTPYGPMNDK